MKSKTLTGYYRHDVLKLLPDDREMIGVELGVAGGIFSKRMVETGAFEHFFGVDVYGDHHDSEEYKRALQSIGLFSRYKLLRMTFDEALELFPDQSCDFVYVDGYAHTGENGGNTIYQWYDKVKIGGVLAGDDYHADWPLVVKAVNTFASAAGLELCVTELTETAMFCKYPSWAVIKKTHQSLAAPDALMVGVKEIDDRKRRKRIKKMFVNEYVRPMLPGWINSWLRFN